MLQEDSKPFGEERAENHLLRPRSIFGRGAGGRRCGREDQAGAQTVQGATEGGAPDAEKRCQRQGEGADESAEQSLLQTKNQPALGTCGHQAVQTGHAPTRLQLHISPEAAAAGRPIREQLCAPSQSGMEMQPLFTFIN